ncbi:MAG: methyltransferase domain-containing protein [Polyangiaceae bacterium]
MTSKLFDITGRLGITTDEERSRARLGALLAERSTPSDRSFDRFLSEELRSYSGVHWTPLAVVVKVADWLDEAGVRAVVDIGSGAGKFCVASALASPQRRLVGIEARADLVRAADQLAAEFGVQDRVEFVEGDIGQAATPHGEAYYLYNPFEENLLGPEARLPGDMHLDEARFSRDVAAVEHLLWGAPPGTVLVTYNGFGGDVPAGFRVMKVDRSLPCVLSMWRKERPPSARV